MTSLARQPRVSAPPQSSPAPNRLVASWRRHGSSEPPTGRAPHQPVPVAELLASLQPPQRSAYHEHATMRARFGGQTVTQPRGRFDSSLQLQPPTPPELEQPAAQSAVRRLLSSPAHRALAERLAAAAARKAAQQARRRHDSVWSACLTADVAAVASEAGLSEAAGASLAAAAARRSVSANPGVLLSQLVRLLPLEPRLGGAGSLSRLLARLPELVRSDPASLGANLQSLQDLLGSGFSTALLARYPQLLTASPFRLQSNAAALQELLGASSASAVTAAVCRAPLLLLASPASLRARAQALQALMAGMAPERLARQLRCTPELLLLRSATVAAKMKCLECLFQPGTAGPGQQRAQRPRQQRQQTQALPRAEALASARAAASSAFSQHRRGGSVAAMGHAPGARVLLARLRQQRLGQGLGTQLATTTSGSSSSGMAIDPRVQSLVLKLPGLLSLHPGTLHSHVLELQLLLALQPDDPALHRIVALQPGLLTQAPQTLANKLQLLQNLTARSEAEAQEMVLRCPAVLTLSMASLRAKWGLLEGGAAACAAWQAQLGASAPVSVAMLLCASSARLRRLQYLAAAFAGAGGSSNSSSSSRRGGLAALPWRSLLQLSDARFQARFPGFAAWMAQHVQ